MMAKPAAGFPRGNQSLVDTTIGWRFTNQELACHYPPLSMGETAENVSVEYGVSRQEQDAFALANQRRAAAIAEGQFADEIVPVTVSGSKGSTLIVDTDEHPRPDTSLESLSKLKPVFRDGGTVTREMPAGSTTAQPHCS